MWLNRKFLSVLLLPLIVLSLSACREQAQEGLTSGRDSLQVVNHRGYLVGGLFGARVVVGEVQNSGATPVRSVKLSATFYDGDGEVLATERTYAEIRVLLPGQKSPFIFFDIGGTEAKRYELELSEFKETDVQPYREFEIIDHSSSVAITDQYHVVGHLRNSGTAVATGIRLAVTFYDAEGKVVAADQATYAQPGELGPGETASFDAAAYPQEAAPEIASYTLQVQAD